MRLPGRILFPLFFGLITLTAIAQPGPGSALGQGTGPGRGTFRFDRDNTPGWSLMISRERIAHREKMLSLGSYAECTAYLDEHHKLMQERAKEKGKSLPRTKADVCERMKARGFFN